MNRSLKKILPNIGKKGVLFTFFLFLFIGSFQANATHIRAGEIIAQRISPTSFAYRITVFGYRFTGSPIPFAQGTLSFGDGNEVMLENAAEFSRQQMVGDEIELNEFVVTHTFPGPGRYVISYREPNRNGGIRNMDNSIDTPFFVETMILIDPFIGVNNSPILTVPPVDMGATGVRYIHNPGAFDADGDSLSYRLTIPRQDRNQDVINYRNPNHPNLYEGLNYNVSNEDQDGPPTFTLDSIIGNLVWDAPGLQGEYNVAFIIEEWRKIENEWIRIGYIVRDMQIIIEETDNERPEIIAPPDICVVAGTEVNLSATGIDPDGDPVLLEAFGGPFQVSSSPATYSPFPPEFQNSPGTLNFTWNTNCSHVRLRPYEVQFKVSDNPPLGPSLVDFGSTRITVVAPAPEGLGAEPQPGRSIALDWNDYACADDAESMQIWRRVDSFDFTPDECETGMPSFAGYELIDRVPIGTTEYLDNMRGEGLNVGATYCYRIVAEFPMPAGGESFVSQEVCTTILADAPVITNVDIETTSRTEGEITVRWTPPFEIDTDRFPPPFTYEVVRGTGFSGVGGLSTLTQTSDTTFRDTGLNTEEFVYNYRIYLYDNAGNLVDTSATASSVRLEGSALLAAAELTWSANVPWSNRTQRFPNHAVNRNRVTSPESEQIVFYDSVNVTQVGFNYLDDGDGQALSDELEYCYFITTFGSYGNPNIREPLINKSQIICIIPNDTVPPCAPPSIEFGGLDGFIDCEEFVEGRSCNFDDFSNTLTWRVDRRDECDQAIASYNIYFAREGEEGPFELLANTRDTTFTHSGLQSFAGCYFVRSIDRSGNESVPTDTICNDNCPNYELPNVFTPNDDGINDVFSAYSDQSFVGNRDFSKCPRFVQRVRFKVVNRWGKEVFTYESNGENSIFINWDGRTNDGRELSTGVYYYVAEVTFDVLDPARRQQQLKGWVHILR